MEGVSLHMPIYFNPWGITKYFVPYMVQIKLTYMYIKLRIVNPYVDGFLNSSGNAMVLPRNYFEVVLCGSVASDAAVVMYRGGFLQVFFKSFPKVLEVSPIYSSSHARSPPWNQ